MKRLLLTVPLALLLALAACGDRGEPASDVDQGITESVEAATGEAAEAMETVEEETEALVDETKEMVEEQAGEMIDEAEEAVEEEAAELEQDVKE